MSCRWRCNPSGIWDWLCLWSLSMRAASAMWAQPVWRLVWETRWVWSQHLTYLRKSHKTHTKHAHKVNRVMANSQKHHYLINRNKMCFINLELWVFLLFQETRGLLGSPSSLTEHLLGLWTATWPLGVRKSWGTLLCECVCSLFISMAK